MEEWGQIPVLLLRLLAVRSYTTSTHGPAPRHRPPVSSFFDIAVSNYRCAAATEKRSIYIWGQGGGEMSGASSWSPWVMPKSDTAVLRLIIPFPRCASGLSYYHNPGSEPLQYQTIGQLATNAANLYGDKDAVVSEHQNITLTFSDAVKQADKLAAGFLELGLNPGDRIGLCSPNTTQWFITVIAAAKAGLILVALNPAYVGHELEYCLRKTGVRAIVAEETFKTQNYYKMLCKMAPEMENTASGSSVQSKSMPSLSFVMINSASNLPGAFRFDDILQSSGSLKTLQEVENKIQADDASCILFTSGTTGHPKGVLQSHFNIINNSYTIGKRIGYQEQKHKILVQTPFFHVFGLVIGICNFLTYGCTFVLPSASFKAEDSIKALKKHKCSVLYGTPTMYIDLCSKVKQLSAEEQAELKSPEIAVSGGALCSPQLFRNMIDCFDCSRVFSVYGQTECVAVSFQSTREDSDFLMTSTVGRVGEHMEAKVVDSEGKVVPVGVPGELYVRGYTLMKGYWDEEEKTKEAFTSDGWLKTGDLFTLLEGGYGQVVGRIKDIIIRGGENISPKEIEDFLLSHPNILEVQVYGVKDERMGEEVCCSIRLKGSETLTTKQVQDFCKGNMAHYKIPKYVEFVDDYPKTVSGKIQKYKLREMMEEKLKSDVQMKIKSP